MLLLIPIPRAIIIEVFRDTMALVPTKTSPWSMSQSLTDQERMSLHRRIHVA